MSEEANMKRSMFMMQLLSPPLPMLCVGSEGEEKIGNSHDLIYTLVGRLAGSPPQQQGENPKHQTSLSFEPDWYVDMLRGPHALQLLDILLEDKEKRKTDEEIYEAMCTYTREIISIAMKKDMLIPMSRSSNKPSADCKTLPDVRFLREPSRVNWASHKPLCESAVHFLCSLIIMREGLQDIDTKTITERNNLAQKSYMDVLNMTINLLREDCATIDS